jgi:hypothetical protein
MGSELGPGICGFIDSHIALMFHFSNSFRRDGSLSIHSGLHLAEVCSHSQEGLNQRTILIAQGLIGPVV